MTGPIHKHEKPAAPFVALVAAFAAFALAGAWPAAAELVYVPLVLDRTIDGVQLASEVRVTNDSDIERVYSYVFIPEGVNGVTLDRAPGRVSRRIAPHATDVLTNLAGAGKIGFLELEIDARLVVSSRSIGTSAVGKVRIGAELPVVDEGTALPAGDTGVLQGLFRTSGKDEADIYLLNLGASAASCVIEVYRASGSRVFEGTFPLKPLSLSTFNDGLGALGLNRITDVSLAVTCDAPVHAFAKVREVQTGEVMFIFPSHNDRTDFHCPAGALLARGGVFHTPSPGNRTKIFEIPFPGGRRFTKLTIDMDFTHGGWNATSDGNHSVVWLYRGDRWRDNVYAYVNLFGPNKDFAKILTNIDISPGVETGQQDYDFEPGVTYHLSYVYDTALERAEAVFTEGGREVVRVRSDITANEIVTREPGFFAVFGHTPTGEGPEVDTDGWDYANVCIQLD